MSTIDSSLVERCIILIREENVILDRDLAVLYGAETKVLIQAVKRNLSRFPADFMFQLTNQELKDLRSQSVTSSQWGGRRYPPYAFTEHGVIMLSSVLNSPHAIQVNIEVVRTFVRLRRILSRHKELAEKLKHLEEKYDRKFSVVFEAIRQLMAEPASPKRQIGYDPG